MLLDGCHACPRAGCGARIPHHWFCCRADWYVLPGDVRVRINTTAHLPILNPERLDTIHAARDAWQVLDEAAR